MSLTGKSAGAVWALLLLTVTPVSGQNTNELNAFDFSLPGARSRGMGGAFVAIADDATAVYSNPAGLNLLFKPEVAIEGRRWTLASAIPNRGHAFGQPSGVGIDTLAGVQERAWESDFTGLSFLSFVYPAGNWAVGVFHHQLARYEMQRRPQGVLFNCSGGFRGDSPPTAPFCEPHAREDGVDRIFPKSQAHDLSIRSNGAAVAFHVTDTFTAGIALQRFDFTLTSRNQVYSARGDKKFEAADFSDANLELDATQQGDDHAWAANVGVLWDVSDEWALGASFRQGPKFTFRARTVTGSQNALQTNLPVGTVVADVDNAFNVPDTYAVGVVFRPSVPWRIGFEYDRVNFGQLFEDFQNVAVLPRDPEGPLFAERGRLDDADQFRLGAEYTWFLRGESAVALRAGVWHDPQHQTYFESDPATGLPAPRWALLFSKRSGQTHWTSGAGVVLGRHLQIDTSVDFSDPGDTFAVSSVWRF